MPLFVAQHRHSPHSCPATAAMGSKLLARVSAATAASYGVTIEAEAVIDAEHRLLLILEAANQQSVEQFLAFLLPSGELQVIPASTAEQAVQRGGCNSERQPAPEHS